MEHLNRLQPMRNTCLPAVLFSTLLVVAQNSEAPILMSHNKVDGPLGGQHRTEDLQVFPNGRVLFTEEGTTALGMPFHASYTEQMDAVEVTHLAALLGSRAARSLPRKIPSKTRPIDFFWQVSLWYWPRQRVTKNRRGELLSLRDDTRTPLPQDDH